ncbi:MAG: hypothetical protein FWJ70_18025, partial [Micromonosporaceae bacterium]
TDLYRQVLALWPEDTFARESLIDLLRAQERWTELVTVRRAEARALPDGPAARRALREAAWVLEVRLGDTASAARDASGTRMTSRPWQRRFRSTNRASSTSSSTTTTRSAARVAGTGAASGGVRGAVSGEVRGVGVAGGAVTASS